MLLVQYYYRAINRAQNAQLVKSSVLLVHLVIELNSYIIFGSSKRVELELPVHNVARINKLSFIYRLKSLT